METAIDLAQNSLALGGLCSGPLAQPHFTTPIATLFDHAVQSVGFRVGALDSANSILIQAYDKNGLTIGQISNPAAGVSLVGLRSNDGNIQGLSVFLPQGMDWEGFTVDGVIADGGTSGEVPEVGSFIIWLAVAAAGWIGTAVSR